MNYSKFIETKIAQAKDYGFPDIKLTEISPVLYPHQRDIVHWAIRGGRRAIFAAFGLGKTFIQLEICRIIGGRENGKVLIICPLGVKQEFSRDAAKLGISTEYVRNDDKVDNSTANVLLTNYERVRDGGITPDKFVCVSLDEASVLRGFGTKTYQEFLKLFPNVKYKFVATATPSPNRYKELIHYAGFLGIMDTGQALTRFFKRDSSKAGNLTLYPHKEKEFWMWMASWACFLSKPSDLGYSDDGYSLPPLNVIEHRLPVDHSLAMDDKTGQMMMFRDSAAGLREAAFEKRQTMDSRVAKTIEIIKADSDEHFVVWHDLEDERKELKKALPECVDVYGSLDLDTREQRIIDFSDGKIKYLATKPIISGSGCNFQRHCHNAIFTGIGYKFNDFIQAVHRIYRFLQTHQVNIHIIYSESESHVFHTLMEKWERHNTLVEEMSNIIKKYGLTREALKDTMRRTIGIERQIERGDLWTAVNNDCVMETESMDENSVDLICTSIPFGNHYEYSPSYNDFGHTSGNDEFFRQMDYLTPQLLRILKPGRVAAIHVKDRVMFGNVTKYGMPSLDAFHAETIMHYKKHGFIFFGMITIETDVVRENNQTYRLGWSEKCKDGTKMGVGCPEYLLLFRKLPTDTSKAYADTPVKKSKDEYKRGRWQIDARAKWNSSGNRFLSPDELSSYDIKTVNACFSEFFWNHVYDYTNHVDTAVTLEDDGHLPKTFETLRIPARYDYVWSDINRMRTLNSEQSRRNLQMHICPLQFDIVERVINRFSNNGELVMDPFGGIMTVPYMAVKMGRKGLGIELNTEYWKDGIKYLKEIEADVMSPSLFDFENIA